MLIYGLPGGRHDPTHRLNEKQDCLFGIPLKVIEKINNTVYTRSTPFVPEAATMKEPEKRAPLRSLSLLS